ncbi:MAG: CvpA family protein [FCB group bacterium]|nr:CvpA family protein [FCB group bacterium]
MIYVDYIILGVLAFFLIKGLVKGLINQVMSIAGMVAGLILAWKFYPLVSEFGTGMGIPQTVSLTISFILIYAAVVFTAKFLGKILHKLAKALFLGWINRAAGAVFGFVEGLLLITILLILFSFTPMNGELNKLRENSPVLTVMQQIAAPFSEKIDLSKPLNIDDL